jgi:hypothetical protein
MSDSSSDKHLGFTPELYPAGTHACYMYCDETERRSVVHPFVLAGLQDDETVHYLADAIPAELFGRALDDRSAATLSRSQLSRLHVVSALEHYCPAGEFIAHDVLERLRQIYAASRTNGSSGCRLAGETSWLSPEIPGSEDIVFSESSINALLPSAPITLMCEYDTELFDGLTLFEILSVHPLMVIHGQVMRNPYYVGPDEYLAALRLENVLGQLLLVELVLTGLPDELRMAEFVRGALLMVPGVRNTHIVLTTTIIPNDDRLESIRQRCFEAAKEPSSLDVAAIRDEAHGTIYLMRSTSRLFGVIIVEVDDADAFAPYQDFLFNIANAVAMAQDSWRD